MSRNKRRKRERRREQRAAKRGQPAAVGGPGAVPKVPAFNTAEGYKPEAGQAQVLCELVWPWGDRERVELLPTTAEELAQLTPFGGVEGVFRNDRVDWEEVAAEVGLPKKPDLDSPE